MCGSGGVLFSPCSCPLVLENLPKISLGGVALHCNWRMSKLTVIYAHNNMDNDGVWINSQSKFLPWHANGTLSNVVISIVCLTL